MSEGGRQREKKRLPCRTAFLGRPVALLITPDFQTGWGKQQRNENEARVASAEVPPCRDREGFPPEKRERYKR